MKEIKTTNEHLKSKSYNTLMNIIKRYELLLEYQCSFPITSIQKKFIELQNKSIVVSDTYFNFHQIFTLLGVNHIFCKYIFATFGGKFHKTIWKKVLQEHPNMKLHYGDNICSDVLYPREFNINTIQVNSKLNDWEKYLVQKHNLSYIAYLCRALRLYFEDNFFCSLYINRWLPILIRICQRIHRRKEQYRCGKILFQSRDMYLCHMLYGVLYPMDRVQYFYISRIAMKNHKQYYEYFKTAVFEENCLIVDLQGTGASFLAFQRNYPDTLKNLHYISVTCDREKVQDQRFEMFFTYWNKYIERLNYATHGSLIVIRNDKPYFFDKEYKEELVSKYIQIVEKASTFIHCLNGAEMFEKDNDDDDDDDIKLVEYLQNNYTPREEILLNTIRHIDTHRLKSALPRSYYLADVYLLRTVYRYATHRYYHVIDDDDSTNKNNIKCMHNFQKLDWKLSSEFYEVLLLISCNMKKKLQIKKSCQYIITDKILNTNTFKSLCVKSIYKRI